MPRISGGLWKSGCYLYVDYTITSQNVAENFSDVAFTFGIHFGAYYFNSTNRQLTWGGGPGTAYLGWSSAPSLPFPHGGVNQDYAYYSASVRVYHDVDGYATASVYGQINPSAAGDGGTRSVFGSFVVPRILRYPGKPGKPVISSITSTSLFATFTDGVGGAAITARQVAWSVNASGVPLNTISSDGSTAITGLTKGTTYYIWSRTQNVVGYSPWSDPATAVTLDVPKAPVVSSISNITQVSARVSIDPISNPSSNPITSFQVGYGLSSSAPTTTVTAVLPYTVTGLLPYQTYYFWVRAINAIGTGPWSAVKSAKTLAGSWIKVAGVWKRAIPFVRVSGVWKVARPWSKIIGVWKETN